MHRTSDVQLCLSQEWDLLGGNNTKGATHCPPAWDGLSCWAPTRAGATATSSCPSFKGSDITKSAFRVCSNTGKWLDRDGVPSSTGWTNYTPCLTPEILEIIRRLGANDDAQTKINIASNTRILEFVGLSLSLGALILSLLIFYYFRTLRNSRTRLHRHLFIALVIQVGIRLTVYTDQLITRGIEVDGEATKQDNILEHNRRGIDNTPYLCEASYISLEYARTAMFMWMFVEGLYLHNMITVTVFEERLSPLVYPMVGWIVPIPLTVAWAIVTHWQYGHSTCWWGYNFTGYFWILEGPRLAVLMVNFGFLLSILRVLVIKIRESNSSETQQALKAVKAALVLLPLLGLTNLLNMIDAPLERSPFQFALWSYTTHLLTSTQGFTLAFLYCFRNGEVQIAVLKFVRIRILGNSRHSIRAKKSVPMLRNFSAFHPSPEEVDRMQMSHMNINRSKRGTLNLKIPNRHLEQTNPKASPVRSIKVRTYCDGVIKQTTIKVGVVDPQRFQQHRNNQLENQNGKRLFESSPTTEKTTPTNNTFSTAGSNTESMENCGPANNYGESKDISPRQIRFLQLQLSKWRKFFVPEILLRKGSKYKKRRNETRAGRCEFI